MLSQSVIALVNVGHFWVVVVGSTMRKQVAMGRFLDTMPPKFVASGLIQAKSLSFHEPRTRSARYIRREQASVGTVATGTVGFSGRVRAPDPQE